MDLPSSLLFVFFLLVPAFSAFSSSNRTLKLPPAWLGIDRQIVRSTLHTLDSTSAFDGLIALVERKPQNLLPHAHI
jgi:hypothetical protein